jgi:hypothetical protein
MTEILSWESMMEDEEKLWIEETEESDLFMDMDLGFEGVGDENEIKIEDSIYDLDLDWFDELELFWSLKGFLKSDGWSEMSWNKFDCWDRWDSDNYEPTDWELWLEEIGEESWRSN